MRRLLLPLVVAAFWAPAVAQAAPNIDVECNGSPTCEGVWFTSPVAVEWSVSGHTEIQGCRNLTIDKDTTGDPQGCTAKGNGTATLTVIVSLDQTPPIISGALPARPPDHAGWYTHPVTFASQATDATSLLDGCDAPSYAGPDAASATIVATCRDKAGNAASRAFPLSYDATPPDPGPAAVKPGDRVVRLSWPAGAEASVTRTPGTDGASSSTIYEGRGTGFKDREVRNGRSYRYVLTLSDDAGNTSSRELAAKPQRQLLAPQREAALTAPPLLKWTPVRHTRYYNVQLFRDGHKILSRWPRHASLQLKHKWRFHGKRYRLKPDEYHWYVWPGEGRRAANRYGDRIGRRSFTVLPG